MLPKNVINKIAENAECTPNDESAKSAWNCHVKNDAPSAYFEARRIYQKSWRDCVFTRKGITCKWSALVHQYGKFDRAVDDGWILTVDSRIPSPKLSDYVTKDNIK